MAGKSKFQGREVGISLALHKSGQEALKRAAQGCPSDW